MKLLLVIALPLLAAASASAATEIAFGPVRAQPGESIRLVTNSESKGGTVELTKDGRTSNGTIRIVRDREISWTFRDPAADGSRRGMISVARIATFSSIMLDGKEEKFEDTSPLNGKMFAMTKSPEGDWTFELDGSIPRQRIQDEIAELTIYLKRQWYPERVVKAGDTWEFDPAWIRMILQNDLPNAKIIGTMTLRQVRHTAHKDIAVIDISVRGSGGDFRADGSEAKVQLELTGQVMVDLKTMLDERLELKGTVITSTGKSGDLKKVTLPLNLVVTKSFGKGF